MQNKQQALEQQEKKTATNRKGIITLITHSHHSVPSLTPISPIYIGILYSVHDNILYHAVYSEVPLGQPN